MSGEKKPKKRRRRPPPETYTISTRVTAPMWDAITRILDAGAYLSTTDYLRDIIRRDLKARGFSLEPKAEEKQPPRRAVSSSEARRPSPPSRR